jgi:ribosomal protein L7/L12
MKTNKTTLLILVIFLINIILPTNFIPVAYADVTEDDCEETYSVYLEDEGESRAMTIKIISFNSGYSLKESMELVRTAPTVVIEGLSYEDAVEIQELLEYFGATASVIDDGVCDDYTAEALDEAGASTNHADDCEETFAIYLEDEGESKSDIIKIIRQFRGLSLKEIWELVSSAPVIVIEGLTYEEALEIQDYLEEYGATVSVMNDGACDDIEDSEYEAGTELDDDDLTDDGE